MKPSEFRARRVELERRRQQGEARRIYGAVLRGEDPESSVRYRDRSTRLEYARALVGWMEAERRAKAKNSTEVRLGVVVVVPQVAAAQWEQMAARGAVIDVPVEESSSDSVPGTLTEKEISIDGDGIPEVVQDGGLVHQTDVGRPLEVDRPAGEEPPDSGADSGGVGGGSDGKASGAKGGSA